MAKTFIKLNHQNKSLNSNSSSSSSSSSSSNLQGKGIPSVLNSKNAKFPATIDAHLILVPMADPHNSEYISDYWNIIPFLSNFHGSNAFIILLNWEKINADLSMDVDMNNNIMKMGEDTKSKLNKEYHNKHIFLTDSR